MYGQRLQKGVRVDKPLTDGRDGLMKAWLTDDHEMMDRLLLADLERNFSDPNSFTCAMARQYQGPDRSETCFYFIKGECLILGIQPMIVRR